MTLAQALLDQAVHPRCSTTDRTAWFWVRLGVGLVVLFVLASVLWPSLWLLLIAPVVGLVTVMHPVCFVTNHHHRNRK